MLYLTYPIRVFVSANYVNISNENTSVVVVECDETVALLIIYECRMCGQYECRMHGICEVCRMSVYMYECMGV